MKSFMELNEELHGACAILQIATGFFFLTARTK
jgi:hypothetical protein